MLMARATFLDPRLKNNGFVTRSGYANVKESVTLRSRPLSAAPVDALPTAMPEQRRAETSDMDDDDELLWCDFDRSAAVEDRNPQASAISLVRQFVEEPNIG